MKNLKYGLLLIFLIFSSSILAEDLDIFKKGFFHNTRIEIIPPKKIKEDYSLNVFLKCTASLARTTSFDEDYTEYYITYISTNRLLKCKGKMELTVHIIAPTRNRDFTKIIDVTKRFSLQKDRKGIEEGFISISLVAEFPKEMKKVIPKKIKTSVKQRNDTINGSKKKPIAEIINDLRNPKPIRLRFKNVRKRKTKYVSSSSKKRIRRFLKNLADENDTPVYNSSDITRVESLAIKAMIDYSSFKRYYNFFIDLEDRKQKTLFLVSEAAQMAERYILSFISRRSTKKFYDYFIYDLENVKDKHILSEKEAVKMAHDLLFKDVDLRSLKRFHNYFIFDLTDNKDIEILKGKEAVNMGNMLYLMGLNLRKIKRVFNRYVAKEDDDGNYLYPNGEDAVKDALKEIVVNIRKYN